MLDNPDFVKSLASGKIWFFSFIVNSL
jgi:hypothetical protein